MLASSRSIAGLGGALAVVVVIAVGPLAGCDRGADVANPIAPPAVCLAAATDDPATWRPLFNGVDLTGWYAWNPTTGRTDAQGIFRAEGGVLHVLGIPEHDGQQDFALLSTDEELENVRLHFEYKWGTKEFNPFAENHWPKDSGFFYALVGPDAIWPTAIEYNVLVHTVGGTVALGQGTLSTHATFATGDALPTYGAATPPYDTPRTADFTKTGVVAMTAALENETDWNVGEVVLLGDASRHLLNGQVVFAATHLRRRVDDARPDLDVPLTRGRVAIQEEGAEIFYRNVRVQRLDPSCSTL